MPLEVANRSWMVHQMLLSEYFINNHRMRVSVLLMLLLRGISLDLCECCIVYDTFERILSPVTQLLEHVRFWFVLFCTQIICCAGLNSENDHCFKENIELPP